MPLYEMIVLVKIGEIQALSGFIKNFVNTAYQGGGILRNVKNLGDRIASREYKAKDGTKHSFCRFLSFEFDADPSTMKILTSQVKSSQETLSVIIHKMNMSDYYKGMVDEQFFKKYENNEIDTEKQNNFIAKNTVDEIVKRMKKEGKKEEEILMEFGIEGKVKREFENGRSI